MRIGRGAAGWLLHLLASAGLVSLATAPGWREMVVPGTLATIEWLVVVSARVLTTPVVPLAEWAGLPIWRGPWLAAGLVLNSVLWVLAVSWLARAIRRRPPAPA